MPGLAPFQAVKLFSHSVGDHWPRALTIESRLELRWVQLESWTYTGWLQWHLCEVRSFKNPPGVCFPHGYNGHCAMYLNKINLVPLFIFLLSPIPTNSSPLLWFVAILWLFACWVSKHPLQCLPLIQSTYPLYTCRNTFHCPPGITFLLHSSPRLELH